MAKKWIALNILLIIAAVGLAREFFQQYEQFKTKTDSARIDQVSVENPASVKAAPGAATDIFAGMSAHADDDYFVISENTLFSDLRGREDAAQPVAAPPPPPLNPKPVLVGTMMVGGEYTASVIDPATQQARNGIPETRRIGDAYRGYTITSIEPEQMVLENSGRVEVIPLNRAARKPQAAKPPPASAARVISIGSSGGGTGGGISVSTSAAGGRMAPAAQQAQQRVQQAQAAAQAAAAQAATQNQRVSVSMTQGELPGEMVLTFPENGVNPSQAKPTQQKPKPGVDAQTGPARVQQRVVRSPFGDIIRPDSE